MLKKRMIGVVVIKDGIAVQSKRFRQYLPIGKPAIAIEYLNIWGVDEIAVVDISASKHGRLDFSIVDTISGYCQVPLTYGGGITTADEMVHLVQAGADKVMINQAFSTNPSIVSEAAQKLGSQCIVVSIDVSNDGKNLRPFDYLKWKFKSETLTELAKKAEQYGAGEIFLNSVDRDGAKNGFDLEAAREVASAVNIPVTLCGGVGKATDFADGLAIVNISAVAAGNFFNYTEHSVTLAKQLLLQKTGDTLRHDTSFDYFGCIFSEDGRLMKKKDSTLKEMLFEYHPIEII